MRAKDSRRMTTRKQQVEATTHFHPRKLARGIVHSRLKSADVYGANQVQPGATQSAFARNWRHEADVFSAR